MRNFHESLPDHRGAFQFQRILDVLQTVTELRSADTVAIERKMNENVGVKFCRRTLNRDLLVLRSLGLIESKFVGRTCFHRSNVKIEFVDNDATA